ncbi:MAG TPA: hypothetical protein VKB18_07950 [Gemmatimonadota bacterium]|nr:hypothetical protein [Gemmatimonadota bacterium]
MNPFPCHAPVRGEDLCDREDPLEAVLAAAGAGRPLAVAGPPGAGVSSLAREATARLAGEGLAPVPVSLVTVADAADLEARLVSALEAAPGRPPARRILVDDADRLAGTGEDADVREAIARAGGGPGPLLFGHDGAALLELLGGADEDVLLEVGPLPFAAWLPYALERFLETDVWVSNDQVEAAHRLVGGHPRHLQGLFHELWDLAGGRGGRVEDEMLQAALERVLGRRAREWRAVWDGLTANQRRFLRGVARAGTEPHPFSSASLERSGLASASSAQRAASSLEGRGLLVRTPGGGLRLVDPLLGRWLAAEP